MGAIVVIDESYRYHSNPEVKKVYYEIFDWLSNSAQHGITNKKEQLAALENLIAAEPDDVRKAFEWFNKVEDGDAIAQCDLAEFFHNHTTGEQSSAAALYWYAKAAENAYPKAQYLMGVFYLDGVILAPDYVRSMVMLRMARNNPETTANMVKYKIDPALNKLNAQISPQERTEALKILRGAVGGKPRFAKFLP